MRAEPADVDPKGPVVRVLELLRCLSDAPGPWTPSELARELRLPRSTVHRLLQVLRAQGLVATDPASGRYVAGMELYRIGSQLAAKMPYARIGKPVLERIVCACDETALLGLYQPARLQMIFAAQAESAKPMRYVIDENVPQSLVWGATGRAILAFLPSAEIARAIAAHERSPATGAALERGDLEADLAAIRARGYAISRGQRIASAVGIAAPFFAPGATVVGDIAITIPDFRFDAARSQELIELVRAGAAQMSAALGFVPDGTATP